MTLSIHYEGRVYRVECPDNCRIYRNPPDVEDCLVIPDPDFPRVPERSRYLLTPFAVEAARRGRYGFRLLAEYEAGAG
jgi:hypothetical protein